MSRSGWPVDFPGVNWMDEAEEAAVVDVVRKGALFRYYGPEAPVYVAGLETLAREFYRSRYALAVNSGTGALSVAMQAMGIGPGDEVIVPSFLWVSTVGAVVQCHAIPVLCEVDESFSMDPDELGKRITQRTKLVVPVHMAGAPCDMGRIMAMARRHGVPVLEDCSQCNGGSFRGRKVGSFGHAGMFSFQINKNITGGEGGLLVTDEDDLYRRMNAVHDVGIPWREGAPRADSPVVSWGQGRRMSELCGAVCRVQLEKLPSIIEHTRGQMDRLREGLSGIPGVALRPQNDPEGDTGSHLILLFEGEEPAGAGAEALRAVGLRTACRVAEYGMHVYSNIPQLAGREPLSPAGNPWSLPQNAPFVREYRQGACPRSDALFARSVILPVPSRLTSEQEGMMIKAIRTALGASAEG